MQNTSKNTSKKTLLGAFLGSIANAFMNRLSGENAAPQYRSGTKAKFTYRPGRAVQLFKKDKQDFNTLHRDWAMDGYGNAAPGIKLARKAALGTVGVPGGRRGMMVRHDGNKLVIGA